MYFNYKIDFSKHRKILKIKPIINITCLGMEEMAQWVRQVAVLTEDSGLCSHTYRVAQGSVTNVPSGLMPSSGPLEHYNKVAEK